MKAYAELEEIKSKISPVIEFIETQDNNIASKKELMKANLSGAKIQEALVEYNQRKEKIFEDLQKEVNEKIVDARVRQELNI